MPAAPSGVTAPGLPINLALQAQNARPLSTDTLQLTADANLTVRGQVQGEMQAAGKILIREADIRIPSSLPPSIATLNVIRPGQKRAAPPAGPAPSIGLDLVIDAPSQIFVRGRGVDAELSGQLRVRGSASKPQVGGRVRPAARRGQPRRHQSDVQSREGRLRRHRTRRQDRSDARLRGGIHHHERHRHARHRRLRQLADDQADEAHRRCRKTKCCPTCCSAAA